MRINPKMFYVPGENHPFEVQEFDGRKIELFYMNDYDEILREQINKGKFTVWSSVDGKNYRLFLEKGLYETVGVLYTPEINKIWVDFWDKAEAVSKKSTNCFLLPIGAVCVLVTMLAGVFKDKLGNIGDYVGFITLGVGLIAMLAVNRRTKSKILLANRESRDLIVKIVGEDKFDELLDSQKSYIDAYYDALYNDEEQEENDNQVTEKKE